jgi:hypothetical protein
MRIHKRFLMQICLFAFLSGSALLSSVAVLAHPNPGDKNSTSGTAPTKPSVASVLNRLPIAFEQNVGQADRKVQFFSRTPNALVSLGSREMYVTVANGNGKSGDQARRTSTTVRFGFLDANATPHLESSEPLPTKTNYYLGNDPSAWRTNIANYREVRYRELYSGIDLLFHGKQGRLEYDFIVAPGKDVKQIQMDMSGAGRVRIFHGDLILQTTGGELKFAAPVLYQERDGERRTVKGQFVLLGSGRVGFRAGRYDHTLPLVIDPVLTYSTFLTGSNETTPSGIAVDSAGEIFVAGTTFASDFPLSNPVQPTFGGSTDAFVSKISTSGTTLVYSTFFGGNNFDSAAGIAIDSTGNAYVAGNAGSTNLPTTPGAFHTSCPNSAISCGAPFAAKFGPSGNLIYSTYLSAGAGVRAMAIDAQGSVYVTGGVSSNSLDVVNAFESQYQGLVSTSTGDAFVQKLSPDGSALVYSTYLAPIVQGGNQQTGGVGIAVDASGSAYVTGQTNATTFPTRNISSTLNASHGIFVVKFKPDGSDLVYAAGIGGSGTDAPTGIALDPSGNAYVVGTAGSTDFPVTPNAFLATCTPIGTGFCTEAQVFALEVSADGSSLVYSTLIGTGFSAGIAVDATGRAFITGSTAQSTFPLVNPIESSLQASANSNTDAFVTALDTTGTPFFSTFLGGAGTDDDGLAIAVDNNGGIYVAGSASGTSNSFPVIDFPLINPGEVFLPCCGVRGAFVSTIHLNSSGPQISLASVFAPIVVIRNVGSSTLNITNIASSTSNLLGGNCSSPMTLPAGSTCFLVVNATVVTITSNAAGSPQSFLVNPTSQILPGPLLLASENSLNFPTQLIGTTSPSQSLTLTNIGNAASTISNIQFFSGPFTLANGCPSVLAVGASCTLSVTFRPGAVGAIGGDLGIIHDNGQRLDLFAGGNTAVNGVAISTPSIQFGSQLIGPTYQPRTIVLTNVDVVPVTISGFSLVGPYSQTNNCPAALSPGTNCRVFVSFNPTANGEVPGSITVTHSSAGSSQTVQLDGTGLILSDLSVSPLQVIFPGNTLIGHPTQPVVVTLENTSTQTITVGAATVTPSVFAVTGNTCAASLAPQATCTVSVTFTPTAEGPVNGELTIVHGGVGNPQLVSVTGTGVTQLIFVPSPVDFGSVQLNDTSAQKGMAIENNSGTPVTVQSISVTGDFQLVPGGQVPPFQLQAFFGTAEPFTFTPTQLGTRTGTVTVVASDSPNPHLITFTGIGIGTGILVAPSTLNFNSVAAGTTSPPNPVTVTNTSSGSVTVQSIAFAGPFAVPFTQTNNCGASIAAGASCTIQVFFAPTMIVHSTGVLQITDSAAGSPQSVSVQGTGTGPSLNLAPTSLNFNTQTVGVPSAAQTVKVTNQLDRAIAISSIAASGDYSQTNNCGAQLLVLATCNINVTFNPTAAGSRPGAVTINDDGADSPESIPLSGTGTVVAPTVTFSTQALNFGNVVVSAGVPTQNVTVSVAAAALNIQSITFSSPMFTQQNTCPGGGVAAGGNCVITVTLKATAPGPINATMSIADNAAGSPQVVQLTASASNYNLTQVSGTGQTISSGQTATFSGNLGAIQGLNETVTLSCSGAPSQASCGISPASIPLTGLNTAFTVTVTTTARPAGTLLVPGTRGGRRPLERLEMPAIVTGALSITLAFFVMWLASTGGGLRAKRRLARAGFTGVLLTGVVVTIMLTAVSCGGGGVVQPPPPPSGTPAGTYTLVISGTSTNGAEPAQSLQLTFTVR